MALALGSSRKCILFWLFSTCFLLWLMIMLGGATRLTHAGLSIVEWRPLTGILPPLSESAWLQEFARYQAHSEFQQRHSWMHLADFKFIYLMEYAHRLLARLIGAWFVIPLVLFWQRGWLTSQLKRRSVIALGLGALQGVMGWYMVKSGLGQDPQVSPYRLTAHLFLAVAIYATLLWAAFACAHPSTRQHKTPLYWWALASCGGVLLTLTYGGLVAGLQAGLVYNTFPLMNEQWLPEDGLFMQPLYKNLFANPAMVQFIHRWLGITTLLLLIVTAVQAIKQRLPKSALMLVAIGGVQVLLGIATLLLQIPPILGVAHQGTAILLFSATLYMIYLGANDQGAINNDASCDNK